MPSCYAALRHFLVAVSFGLSVVHASGQCADFSSGFGIPGNGLNGHVTALSTFDDGAGSQLYAAGYFYNVGGGSHVARWNGSTWSAVSTDAPFDEVSALHEWDDGTGPALYAAGSFSSINGVPASSIARWNGTWSPLGAGLTNGGGINCMTVFDDGTGEKLYIGGSFTQSGGITTNRIASWDGTTWASVGSLPAEVTALGVFDIGSGPQLFAGGYFSGLVRRWNGTTWSTVGGGLFGTSAHVTSMLMHDDGSGFGLALYVGGWVSGVGHVARWNGSAWQSLPSWLDGNIERLETYNAGAGIELYAAGSCTGRIARWTGSSWTQLTSGITGSVVRDLVVHNDGSGLRLFAGGDFTAAGGIASVDVARYGQACSAPNVIAQPQSATAVFDGLNAPVPFDVAAEGTAPLAYQWRKDGQPLTNVPAHISGATTNALRIQSWNYGDDGDYDCVISNAFGSTASDVATLTVPLGPSGLPVQVSRILHTPEQVGNLPPGAMYTTFYSPVQSPTAEVAFVGDIIGDSLGEWSLNLWQAGVAGVLHRRDEQAPGCESGCIFATSGAFSDYSTAADGRVAFSSILNSSAIPNGSHGIWYRDSGGTLLVARSGTFPAGGLANEIWGETFSHPVVADSGRVAFWGEFYVGTTYQDTGAWTWDSTNGPQLLMRSGEPAIGVSATFTGFSAPRPITMNALGEMAVIGQLNGNESVIWLGHPGALQVIARTGDPAPGYGVGDVLGGMGTAMVTDNGDVVFSAAVSGPSGAPNRALYRYSNGGLTLLVRRFDLPPDAPATVAIGTPQLLGANSAGDVIFYCGLSNNCSPCPTQGLYLVRNGVLLRVVTDYNGVLPGAPSGFTLQAIKGVALNESGQVAFECTLGNGSYGSATYGWTESHGLFPIAAPGSQLEISTGQYRTVDQSFLSATVGGISGLLPSSSLTDSGNVVIHVKTTDSQDGIWSGQFLYFQGLQFGPSETMCVGDGSGAPCPCGNVATSLGHGCANSTGDGAALDTLGSARVSADDLQFAAHALPLNRPAVLFQATTPLGGGLGAPFKDGLRCAGGLTRRYTLMSSGTSGTVAWGPGLALHGQWVAGETRYFQVWYRDAGGSPCSMFSNMTNAERVTFIP